MSYLVSLIHFLPFSATAVWYLSHYNVYQRMGKENKEWQREKKRRNGKVLVPQYLLSPSSLRLEVLAQG